MLITAFGRAVSEVGAVMIVGGNIDGFTRVMTTAIALETSKGDLPLALALGLVLLGVVLAAQPGDRGAARLARAGRRRRGRCDARAGAWRSGHDGRAPLFSLRGIVLRFGKVQALARRRRWRSRPASGWR